MSNYKDDTMDIVGRIYFLTARPENGKYKVLSNSNGWVVFQPDNTPYHRVAAVATIREFFHTFTQDKDN